MNDVADTLNTAALIVENGWTQRAYARDGAGNDVGPSHPGAVAYCAAGAIMRAAGATETDYKSEANKLANRACALLLAVVNDRWPNIKENHTVDVTVWNDDHGRHYSEVADALRTAAQTA